MEEREDHIQKVFRQLLDKNLPGQQLWSVITALRGPDTGGWAAKYATTGVIRYAVGFRQKNGTPPTSSNYQNIFTSNPDSEEHLFVRLQTNTKIDHFGIHAFQAFEALGLKWDEVNR